MMALTLIVLISLGNTTATFHQERHRPMIQPVAFTIKRPLLSLSACAALADRRVEELVPEIERGSIRVAFNIAAPGSSARCLRVLSSSLAEWLQPGRRTHAESPAQLLAEVSAIFPALSPDLSSENMVRLLACSFHHLTNLHGCLRVTRPGTVGRGNGARFCRKSAINFLLSRRVV